MKRLAFAGIAVVLVHGWLSHVTAVYAGAEAEQGPGIWGGGDRVVAVGDVHGDYEQLAAVLRSAKIINDQGNWTGGKTHLVQTGDVVDRGPDSRKAMDLLMRLEKQAAEAGGYRRADSVWFHCAIGRRGSQSDFSSVGFCRRVHGQGTDVATAASGRR